MMLFDSLKSFVGGLGTAKDKSASLGFDLQLLDQTTLSAMHRSDWLSRKIVDIIPNDMTREWRDWQAKPKQIEEIEEFEASTLINVQIKVNSALQRARLYGGAAIFLGMKDGRPQEELDIERVEKGDLQYLHVLNRYDVTPGEIERDVTSIYYGQPKHYDVRGSNGSTAQVHPSRMIRFIGAPILDETVAAADGWGDSVLQVIYDAVRNAASAQGHVAGLIPEAKTDVIYIPGLSDFLKDKGNEKLLTDRFAYASTMKSMFNMMLLEGNGANGDTAAGEKWEQKQINFAQLPELMRQFLQIASGAADIPVTRLLGESPSGLNATGKSDLQNYYDNIAARQRTEMQPALHRLDEVLIRSALGERDPDIHYAWAALWGLSDKEKADIFKIKADAARAIAGSNGQFPLMPVEALSDSLVNAFVEDGSLPGLEAAIKKYGTLAENGPDEDDVEPATTPAANANEPAADRRRAANDAQPRTLYVRRDVLNAVDIIAWAKEQGFETTLPADDMHVTIAFSRTAIDWMKVGESWAFGDGKGTLTVNPGGPRMMEKFGRANVLLFSSSELAWRHMAIREAGASWDHPEYQPHITISYAAPAGLDLAKVEPYRGKIDLGPEIFAEVKEDWRDRIYEE